MQEGKRVAVLEILGHIPRGVNSPSSIVGKSPQGS